MKLRRETPTVNASSMADIAFLLLIFFLVTTTIVVDKGIMVKLPHWSDDPITPVTINTNNVWSVKINSQDRLLVRGELMEYRDLKEKTKEFILNPMKKDNLPPSPKKAIISLQNDRGTSYETYITVYNELKAAYNEIWEAKAQTKYQKSYKNLSLKLKRDIRREVPLVISEAEPTNYLTEN